MKHTLVAFSLFLLCITSCKKDDSNDCTDCGPATAPAVSATMLNVSYGNDPLQKMDVYLPGGRTTASTKLIIIIHGGSWSFGDKTEMTPIVDSIKRRMPDYAVININYRLASLSGNTFPTQENDVKAAVDYIYGKRSEYFISDKFVTLGVSAGSHLALLQAYKYSTPKIKAVVDFVGPTDMAEMYNNPASPQLPTSGIALLLNGTPTTNPGLYASSSPVTFVNAQSPPTILLRGGLDELVRYQQGVALRDKLALNNVAFQFVFYPNEGHIWVGANLVDSFNKVQDFLNTYVQ